MGVALLLIGILWLAVQLISEAGWNTKAYDGKELDITKMYQDSCGGKMSKSEFKRNYRNGKYVK